MGLTQILAMLVLVGNALLLEENVPCTCCKRQDDPFFGRCIMNITYYVRPRRQSPESRRGFGTATRNSTVCFWRNVILTSFEGLGRHIPASESRACNIQIAHGVRALTVACYLSFRFVRVPVNRQRFASFQVTAGMPNSTRKKVLSVFENGLSNCMVL